MPNNNKKSVFFFVFPGYLFVTLAALFAAGMVGWDTLSKSSLESLENRLNQSANYLIHRLEITTDLEELDSVAGPLRSTMDMRVTLIDSAGVVHYDTDTIAAHMDNHKYRTEIEEARLHGDGFSQRYSATIKRPMLYFAKRLDLPEYPDGVLRIAMPVMVWEERFNRLVGPFVLGILVISLLAIFISYTVSQRLTSQLQMLKKGAEAYAEQVTQESLPEFPWSEFQSVASSLHHLAVQLHHEIQDVSQQKNEREAILSSMVQALVAVNEENRIMWYNQRFQELVEGEGLRQIKGARILEIIRNSDLGEMLLQIQDGGGSELRDIESRRSNGEDMILRTRSAPMHNQKQELVGVVFTFIDITRLHKLESMRQDFVANVSHELRTPITSVQGAVETISELVEDEVEVGQLKPFLNMVLRQSERMNAIITDLLTLSQLDTENTEQLEKEEVDLCHLAEVVANSYSHIAEEKGSEIVVEMESGLTVMANESLLEQALVNLITNALRYSDKEKSVKIQAAQEDHFVGLSVQDQGWGMENRHLDRIFERFYRVDKARTRALGGTGLGLSITKHIILLHHGKLEVESEPGVGSKFSILLPVFQSDTPSEAIDHS